MLTIPQINAGMIRMEKRLAAISPIDGKAHEAVRLVLHPDGSGSIESRVRDQPDDEAPIGKTDNKRMLRAVFAEWREYRGFASLSELDRLLA